MPLYKSIAINEETHVLVWLITEPLEELKRNIKLNSNSKERISRMKSEQHQKAYYSVRQLLSIAAYNDDDLSYDTHGKPTLNDGVFISISHSNEYATIVLSGKAVGIDIEKQQSKIEKLASKFINEKEEAYVKESSNPVETLTLIWGAKEALFKIHGEKGISFKQHMSIAPFELPSMQTGAAIHHPEHHEHYEIYGIEFDGFTLVVAH